MMIVGQVSDANEAKEIEIIAKSFLVGCHARFLATTLKDGVSNHAETA